MLAWLKNWLKWQLAGDELEALARWRSANQLADRWLAEFPDAVNALGFVEQHAERGGVNIVAVRNLMRTRRIRAGHHVEAREITPADLRPHACLGVCSDGG